MSKVKYSVNVLLVSNLEQSKEYYKNVLDCEVTDWYVTRDDFALGFKLMEANHPDDVQPNKPGKGQSIPWDTYAYIESHDELDELYNQVKEKGANFAQESTTINFDWGLWKEFAIKDPDNYVIAFGSGKINK